MSGQNKRTLATLTATLAATLTLVLVSCSETDEGYQWITPQTHGDVQVTLAVQTRASEATAIYGEGTEWENYIGTEDNDLRVYFFTYSAGDETDNTLITVFTPTEISAKEDEASMQYTMTGSMDDKIMNYANFKVVVLANWGSYPTVTESSTIDDLVEGANTTFSASTFLTECGVDETHRIPFFGVQEFTGIDWSSRKQDLKGVISLLRAIAKVEVIVPVNEKGEASFSSVEIVNYNASGYCAPKGVYVSGDYDTEAVHLVGELNDVNSKSSAFNSTVATDDSTVFTAYIPEYDNSSSGATPCYIRLTQGDTSQPKYSYIHFMQYGEDAMVDQSINIPEGGTLYDITRNSLYRFSLHLIDGYSTRGGDSIPSINVEAERLSW